MTSRALLSAVALLAMIAIGCPTADAGSTAIDPSGAFAVELAAPARETGSDNRHAWTAGRVTLAVQRVQRTRTNADATLEEVAEALTKRYRLGEVDGELSHRPCELDGVQARCLSGAIQDGARRVLRHGWLVVQDESLLLVEVIAAESARSDFERQIELVERTLRWTG